MKIKVNGLPELRKKLSSSFKIAINRSIRDKALRTKVGEIIRDDIRNSFSASPAASTKKYRAYLEQYNATHPSYSRNKINITFTGELLEDLAKNVKADTTRLALIVEHSDKKHKIYKVGKARKRKKAPSKARASYSDISEWISKDYDYLQISDQASKIITKEIRKTLFKYLGEVLK